MVFKEKEVIELSGGKKYIVAKTKCIENHWYYALLEVNKEETDIINKSLRIITTVSENNNIFIKNIKGELAQKLEDDFKKELNID